MENNLEEFNKIITFFLRNYEARLDIYEKPNLDLKKLKSINKGEKKILKIIVENIKNFEKNLYSKYHILANRFDKLNTVISKIIEALNLFLNKEKKYLEEDISKEDLKIDLVYYQTLKNSIPFVEIENLLKNVDNIDKSLSERVLDYFSHLKDIRNTWIFPAVFVELFGLIYSSWNTLSKDVEWVHTSAGDFLQFYLIVIILVVFKMPDNMMKIYDLILEKK